MVKKYTEITPTFYRFQADGDTVEGKLVERTLMKIAEADVVKYTVEDTATDGMTTFLGGRQLDPIMDSVKVGTDVKVVLSGREKTSGGYTVKTFKVYIAEPETEKPAAKLKVEAAKKG